MTQYIKGKDGKFAGSIGPGVQAPKPQPHIPQRPSPDVADTSPMISSNSSPFPLDTSHWDTNPVDAVRELYVALQPRISEVSAGTASPAENARYRWILRAAAERSLKAKEEGKRNLASMWYCAMEYTRFTQTDHVPASDKEALTPTAWNFVERMTREDSIEALMDKGFGRELAEQMERMEFHSGSRYRWI